MMPHENPAKFEKRRQAWKRIGQRGKLVFVLYKGVFLWGGSMFAFSICYNAFWEHNRLDSSLVYLAVNALASASFGALWALLLWNRHEKGFGGLAEQ